MAVEKPTRNDGNVRANLQVDVTVGTRSAMDSPQAVDMRDSLTAMEFASKCPFAAKRLCLVHGVPNKSVRGEHAHHTCHQFLIATLGSAKASVDSREIVGQEHSSVPTEVFISHH